MESAWRVEGTVGFQKLEVYERNDEVVDLTLTYAGQAYNLTGKTIEMYLKPTSATADTDPSVFKLSTATGEIVITNPGTLGQAVASVPAADLVTAGSRFYRVDIIDAGKRRTALYGPLRVINL